MSSTALTTPAVATTVPAKAPGAAGDGILPVAPTPPTGTWRHPQLDSISRKQAASFFLTANLRRAVLSAYLLVLTFTIPAALPDWLKSQIPDSPYAAYLLLALQLLFTLNIASNLRALYMKPYAASDVPLTPNQRALLGLGPSSAPQTPGSTYITPPRYARSTSRSASSSRAATLGSTRYASEEGSPIGGSPLAGRGVGASIWGAGSSPASGGSPWVRKAVEGRRLSSGGRFSESVKGSPLARELSLEDGLRASSMPGTPTPAGGPGRNVSVKVNSKWRYQKLKESPRGVYS